MSVQIDFDTGPPPGYVNGVHAATGDSRNPCQPNPGSQNPGQQNPGSQNPGQLTGVTPRQSAYRDGTPEGQSSASLRGNLTQKAGVIHERILDLEDERKWLATLERRLQRDVTCVDQGRAPDGTGLMYNDKDESSSDESETSGSTEKLGSEDEEVSPTHFQTTMDRHATWMAACRATKLSLKASKCRHLPEREDTSAVGRSTLPCLESQESHDRETTSGGPDLVASKQEALRGRRNVTFGPTPTVERGPADVAESGAQQPSTSTPQYSHWDRLAPMHGAGGAEMSSVDFRDDRTPRHTPLVGSAASLGEAVYTTEEVTRLLQAKEETHRQTLEGERELAQRLATVYARPSPPPAVPPSLCKSLLSQLDKGTPRKYRKDMNVDTFDGKEDDWLDYQTKFDAAARWNQWDKADQLQQLVGHLKGAALALYADHRPTDYGELIELLKDRYTPEGSEETYKMRFRARQLELSEEPEAYAQELSRLARRAYPDWTTQHLKEQVLDQFKMGLTVPALRKHVMLGKYPTLSEAVVAASAHKRYEEGLRPAQLTAKAPGVNPVPSTRSRATVDQAAVIQQLERPGGVLSRCYAAMANWPEQQATPGGEPPHEGQLRSKRRRNMVCWVCGMTGHGFTNCLKNSGQTYVPTDEQQQRVVMARERYVKNSPNNASGSRANAARASEAEQENTSQLN